MTPTEQRRAEFEECASKDSTLSFERFSDGMYVDLHVRVAWYFWQAAADLYERKGMERAREICKKWAGPHNWGAPFVGHPDAVKALTECADAIEREMKGGDANA